LRPDVVLFGEELPVRPSWVATRALRDCDLFLAIGTSGTVAPASDFARVAACAGARTIYLNLEPMQERNPAFQEEHLGRAEELLPRLIGLD
jgi:NAD-dependent deacetylase